VRYGDPEWHLRLRLHGSSELLHTRVLPLLQAAAARLLHTGLLWRIQLDTYDREVERYGGLQGMLLAEKLFHADSELLLSIAEAFPGDQGQDARWLLSLRAIDTLLTVFGLDLQDKRILMDEGRRALGHQFQYGTDVKRQLGNKYRQQRRRIEDILDSGDEQAGSLQTGLDAIQNFSATVTSLAEMLAACADSGHLQQPIRKLLLDFTHMHANRSFRSSQPAQEFILYDFLVRFYESKLARTGAVAAK
jgi:thiopeptide-type bacteriocin biosynthesis protein